MMNESDQFRLDPRDADALDRLGSLAGEATPGDARQQRLVALIGLLDTPAPAVDPSLADATLARLPMPESNSLRREDARGVDAWTEARGRLEQIPGTIGERARKVEQLAALVRESPATAPADLADRTMTFVQNAIDASDASHRLPEAGRGFRLRISDVVSVAAMLLIGASVVWPILTSVREQSRRELCQGNLADVVRAFGGYASDYRSALPSATAGYAGGTWLATGRDPSRSNSANLYRLVESRYVEISELACPGNPRARLEAAGPDEHDWRAFEEVSYSYRVMAGAVPQWGDPTVRTVVLADRSPVFLRAVRGLPVHPMAGSPNHGGLGQHVVFNDGTVAWSREPVMNGEDNIWLPRSVEDELRRRQGVSRVQPMSGTEAPGSVDDAFVGP